jgi:hypothetical protein
VYTWQVPGKYAWKTIRERILKTGEKLAEFSSEKINPSWP